jgi:hypothetical protein
MWCSMTDDTVSQDPKVSALPLGGVRVSRGCFCGRVRYVSTADPITAVICQCRDCQVETGTGHSCQVMLPKASVTLIGEIKRFAAEADSGNATYRGFCPECGSSLIYGSATYPDAIFVTAGTLDDPTLFKPAMVVFARSAQSWDRVDPLLRKFEAMPPLRR